MNDKYAGHTPGPWEYDGDYIWAAAIQGYVADPQTEDMRSGESVPLKAVQAIIDANARLIADAPTLLADRDALAARCEKLREALRRIAVKPSSAVATHCSLCNGSWAFNRPDGEWHEPGCLAAPKDAP